MKRIFSLSPLIAMLLLCSGVFAEDAPLPQKMKEQLPMVFVENKGQLLDENHNRRTDIDIYMRAPGMDVFVGNGQIHYQWNRIKGDDLETYRIDVVLEGANMTTTAVKEEQQGYVENYFLPQCPNGLTVNTFKKITYRNIYPNIDWVLYTQDGGLKYNFIVHPGGDAGKIKLRYKHADLSMTETGLTASTPFGSITEEAPYSYIEETGKEIPSSFALTDDLLQFNVAASSQTIVIDPYVRWATYFGVSDFVEGYATAVDRFDNAYLGGRTNQPVGTIFNAYQYIYGGGISDGYITKFNDTCWRMWSTFYGAEGNDMVLGLGFDSSGYLYVMGQTYSMDSNVISTVGSFQRQNAGSIFNGLHPADVFLVKFDPAGTGTRIWATYYGGTTIDLPNSLWVAPDGSFVIGGLTNSQTGLGSSGAYKTNPDDGFIAKFNSNGTRAWGTYYLGEVKSVAMDTTGSVYAGGLSNTYSNTSTTGAHQALHGGGVTDAYIVKFGPTGSRIWGSYYGGLGEDIVTAVSCDIYGNFFVGGQTTSNNAIATTGAYKTTLAGYYDAFLARFNATTGVRIWCTYIGGNNGHENISKIICDSSTKIWVTGNTSSYNGVAMPGAFKTFYSGPPPGMGGPSMYGDVMFAKFTLKGEAKYCTYFGGAEDELNLAAYYSSGNVYFAGTSRSNQGGCSTPNGYQGAPSAGPNPPPPFPASFIAKMNADTALYFRKRYLDTILCLGDTRTVSIGVINPFRPSTNVFTVQLSDSGGNFANAVNIGTSNTNTKGDISFTIPMNTIPGSRYRIRVLGGDPVDTTFFDNGINIRISDYPVPKVMLTGAVCAGGVVDIVDTGISPLSTVRGWKGPNNITGTGVNLHYTNVSYADSGYYVLTSDNYGCIRKDSVYIKPSINPLNSGVFSNSPVCEGDTLRVWGSTTSTNVKWYWFKPAGYFPDSPADTTIYAAALTDAGVYKGQAVFNGCFSPLDSVVVVVNPSILPTVTLSANPGASAAPGLMVTFTSAATNQGTAPQYRWTNKGIYIPGATGPTYAAKMAIELHTGDTICVEMTSNAVCPLPATVSSCLGIFVDIGVDKLDNDVVQLYPNPSNGSFTINAKAEGILYVSNIQGQQIAAFDVSKGRTNITMPECAPGVYLGRFVQDEGKSTVVRIIID